MSTSINDRLGPGGLESVAILQEDTSGNTVLVGADGLSHTINIATKLNDSSANSAASNAITIQKALDAQGEVKLTGVGICWIDRTLLIGDETTLDTGSVTIKIANGVLNNILRNKHCQDIIDVSTISVSGGIATVTQNGLLRAAGDSVYIEGAEGNTAINGFKTVLSASMGTWTFAVSGGNPTNASGVEMFVVNSNSFAGSNLSRTSNLVTVTETGHKRHVGDHLYLGAGTLSDTSFAGLIKITSVTPGVSWTYASTGSNGTPTGAGNLLGNYGIELKNFRADGNKTGNSSPVPLGGSGPVSWGIVLGNASRTRVQIDSLRNVLGRGFSCFNVADFYCPVASSDNTRVPFQFDSHCDRVNLGAVYGYTTSDDVVAWGVTINAGALPGYLVTRSPSGPGDMGSLRVGEIKGFSNTSLFKLYCGTGYNLDDIEVGKVNGNGCIVVGDSSDESTSGGGFDSLKFGILDFVPTSINGVTKYHSMTLGGTTAAKVAFTTGKRSVLIDKFINNNAAGSGKQGISIGCPLSRLTIGEFLQPDKSLTEYSIVMNTGGSCSNVSINGGEAGNGSGGCFIKYSDAAANSITDLYLKNFNYLGSDAVNRYGTLIDNQIGGALTNLYLDNVRVKDSARFYYLGGATQVTNLYINNLSIDNCQWGTYLNNPGADINVFFNGIRVLSGGIVNSVFGWAAGSGGTGTRIVGSGVECPAGKFIYAGSGSYRFSLDCPERDAGWDFSGTYAAKNTPRAGDKVWNTGTAWGVGVGLYEYLSAAAWSNVGRPKIATASRNAWASAYKGMDYFDTTLNKIVVAGGTAWEAVTSV